MNLDLKIEGEQINNEPNIGLLTNKQQPSVYYCY